MLTTLQIIIMMAGIVGGLACFLYGMNVMSSSLTQFAGGRLERVIEKVTENRYVSWLFGTGVTAIVQSSSATTVMTVGLVNSGIMKLSQAAGLIIGANLGTTATAWILSLNGIEGDTLILSLLKPATIMPFVALAGVAMQMFSHSERKKLIGNVLIGFGIMMIGMSMMSNAVTPLKDVPEFENYLINFSMPVIGFLFAILFTMIIQSSDATIGILQALAITVCVNFRMAVVIVCGAQIGTCITAMLASFGSGRNAKRTALIHLFYNLIKNVPFVTVFLILDSISPMPFMSHRISTVGIAVFHSAINLLFSVIILPMVGILEKLAVRAVPYTEAEDRERAEALQYLDPLLFRNPSLAIAQARKAANTVSESVLLSFDAWLYGRFKEAEQYCECTLRYLRQTESYMTDITKKQLMNDESEEIRYLMMICNDFTIISNQITALTRIGRDMTEDLKLYGEAVRETLEIVEEGFTSRSTHLAATIQVFREVIAGLSHKINARQISRQHKNEIGTEKEIPFIEISFSFERIMDRCDHIAGSLIQYDSINPWPVSGQEQADLGKRQQQICDLFRDKYTLLEQ